MLSDSENGLQVIIYEHNFRILEVAILSLKNEIQIIENFDAISFIYSLLLNNREKKRINWKFEFDMMCNQLIAICYAITFVIDLRVPLILRRLLVILLKKLNKGSPDEEEGLTGANEAASARSSEKCHSVVHLICLSIPYSSVIIWSLRHSLILMIICYPRISFFLIPNIFYHGG